MQNLDTTSNKVRLNYRDFIDKNFNTLVRLFNDNEGYTSPSEFGLMVYNLYDTDSQAEMQVEGILYEGESNE